MFNIEFGPWGSTVIIGAAIVAVLLLVTAWGMWLTVIVGLVALAVLVIVLYYCGRKVDRKLRHGWRA